MHSRNGPSYSPSGMSNAKRPRMEDDYGAGNRYKAPVNDFMGGGGGGNMSSRVVQVRNLKDQVMDADLVDALSHFGPISYVSLTGRGVALVEFEELTAAERCVSYNMNSDILVLGQAAIFSFSPLQIIPRQGWESERPNNVVVMYVQNPKYPITTDVVSAICKPICRVMRIVIMRENGQIQCLVEFSDIEAARNIKQRLNGCDIYSGCCTLKIEFAKLTRLTVVRNDQDQADYVTPPSALGADSFSAPKDRPALLQEPPAFGGAQSRGFDDFGSPPTFDRDRGVADRYPGQPSFNETPRRGPFIEDEFMMNGRGRMGADPFGPPMPPQPPMASYQAGNGADRQRPDGTGIGMEDSVISFFGLDPEKMNCEKLFNLVCQYGNVVRIKFLKSKPDQAMVQMGDPLAAKRVIECLNKCVIFGGKISISASRQAQINETRDPAELPDKTLSYQDFSNSRHNRFLTADLAHKNRISPPQKFLYFYHAPSKMSDEDLMEWVEKNGGVKPTAVKIFEKRAEGAKSSAGILDFESEEDAIDTIVSCNHMQIDTGESKFPFSVKFCFAGPAGSRGSDGPFNGPAGRSRGLFEPRGRGSFESRGRGRGGSLGSRGRGFGARGDGGDSFRDDSPSGGGYRGGSSSYRGSRGGGEFRGRGGSRGRGRGAPRGY